jgi:4'-phosphopantetheinyl transferase
MTHAGRPARCGLELGAAPVTWLVADVADVPAELDWLGDHERARLAQLRVPKRRGDFLLGRWTAKRAIAAYLGGAAPPVATIEARAAPSGAPEVFIAGEPQPIAISISHSAGRGLAIVTSGAWGAERAGAAGIGCDLERVEPRSPLLVEDYFTLDEAARVAAAPAALRDRQITLIWSAKESALKALRVGLRADLRRARVSLGRDAIGPSSDWRALRVAVDGARDALAGWWLERDGFVLTMVGAALAPPHPRPA